MTDLSNLGLPLDITCTDTAIKVESALAWIQQNTTFEVNLKEELPANVKLFVMRYCDIFSMGVGVTSESLGGMSQSFSSEGAGSLLRQYASELLGEWYSSCSFTPAIRKW